MLTQKSNRASYCTFLNNDATLSELFHEAAFGLQGRTESLLNLVMEDGPC